MAAINDMAATGILASVTLAQACLESAFGTSELSINACNLFGMKAILSNNMWLSQWDGSIYKKFTKEQYTNGTEYTVTAEFRKYSSFVQSIKDHSDYLNGAMNGNKMRYTGLSGCKNYRTAAQLIKDGGYATDTQYADKLCNIIEMYNLTQYDGGKNAMKICLDAGHYGKYNQSPADSKYYESDMAWKLHILLKGYLEQYGIQVVTTRINQATDKAVYERGVASKGCNLLISLHSNATGTGLNNSIDYPASYCAISGSADGIGLVLAKAVESTMGTKQAARIEHRSGSNGDYYGVLRGATAVGVPSIILEHSFHSNANATAWLLKDSNLDKLAKAEADAIVSYYNIKTIKHSGWVQENDGWRFYLGDTNTCVKNDWYMTDEKWYWFDGSGMMVTNVWYMHNGHWYYLGNDGAMLKGLQDIAGKWYYLNADGMMAIKPIVLTPDNDGALQYPGIEN